MAKDSGGSFITGFLVGGIVGMINSISINFNDMLFQNYILFGITALFVLLIFSLNKIGRLSGLIFISIYFIFIFLNFKTFN